MLRLRRWGMAFSVGTLCALLPVLEVRGQAEGDDAPPPQVSTAASEPAPFTHVPEELSDPGFDKYVDYKLLTEASLSLNADALTDVALQLREGERVLLRSHKSLKPAALADAALKVAVDRGDAAAIDRLAKVAEAWKDEELAARVKLSKQLAAKPRAIAALPPVPESQEHDEDVVQSHLFMVRLDQARALGDAAGLKALQAEMKPLPKKAGSLMAFVDQQIAEAVASVETDAAGQETASLLRKLSATSRGACEGPYQEGSVSSDGRTITTFQGSKRFYIDTSSDKIYFPDMPSWGWVPRNSCYGLMGRFGALDIRSEKFTGSDSCTYQVYFPSGQQPSVQNQDYVQKGTPSSNGFKYTWVGLKDVAPKTFPTITNQGVSTSANQIVAAGGGNITISLPPNIVAAGGGNIVAAGGGNIVAAGGGNVIDGKKVKLDLLPKSIVAAGGGNLKNADGYRLIGKGGAGLSSYGLQSISTKSSSAWRSAPRLK